MKACWFQQITFLQAVVLGMDSAMDDTPLFSPPGDQVWQAYLCRKKLMLLFMFLDEDFALFHQNFCRVTWGQVGDKGPLLAVCCVLYGESRFMIVIFTESSCSNSDFCLDVSDWWIQLNM